MSSEIRIYGLLVNDTDGFIVRGDQVLDPLTGKPLTETVAGLQTGGGCDCSGGLPPEAVRITESEIDSLFGRQPATDDPEEAITDSEIDALALTPMSDDCIHSGDIQPEMAITYAEIDILARGE